MKCFIVIISLEFFLSLTSKKLLRFIHVGKCGGSTIEKLLLKSPLVAQKYYSVVQSHVGGVPIDTSCDYLLCLRNPISRAISAYEWRRKLVISDPPPNQAGRFRGELDVLNSYSSFSDLASKLYHNTTLNQLVARDFQLVHHLRESISFYIKSLLPILTVSNVYGVICQETLAIDCEMLLGVSPKNTMERKNYSRIETTQSLSRSATDNLKRYLLDDYTCLVGLWSAGVLNDKQFKALFFANM